VRREWGAVTFVLTVIVGMIVVPVALYFTNVGPKAVAVPTPSVSASPSACPTPSASPSPSAKPTKSPTPSATASP